MEGILGDIKIKKCCVASLEAGLRIHIGYGMKSIKPVIGHTELY